MLSRVGVRLGEHTVSTSRDCVDKGSYGQDCTSDQTVDVGIEKKIVHPNYRAASLGNDIALLKLNRDVTYTRKYCLYKNTMSVYKGQLKAKKVVHYKQTKYMITTFERVNCNLPKNFLIPLVILQPND